jgi:hypothetical protein
MTAVGAAPGRARPAASSRLTDGGVDLRLGEEQRVRQQHPADVGGAVRRRAGRGAPGRRRAHPRDRRTRGSNSQRVRAQQWPSHHEGCDCRRTSAPPCPECLVPGASCCCIALTPNDETLAVVRVDGPHPLESSLLRRGARGTRLAVAPWVPTTRHDPRYGGSAAPGGGRCPATPAQRLVGIARPCAQPSRHAHVVDVALLDRADGCSGMSDAGRRSHALEAGIDVRSVVDLPQRTQTWTSPPSSSVLRRTHLWKAIKHTRYPHRTRSACPCTSRGVYGPAPGGDAARVSGRGAVSGSSCRVGHPCTRTCSSRSARCRRPGGPEAPGLGRAPVGIGPPFAQPRRHAQG